MDEVLTEPVPTDEVPALLSQRIATDSRVD